MPLTPVETTARAVEISKGLTALPTDEAIFSGADLKNTRETGVLARASAILRGQQTVTARSLRHIAQEVGASWTELEGIYLPKLSDMGWGEMRKEGRKFVGFHEQIPPVDEVLRTLGKDWEEQEPTPYDLGSVQGLHLLSERPFSRDAFASELGMDPQTAKDVVEYGLAGTYFDEADKTLWSPLFFNKNDDEVVRFLDSTSEAEYQALQATCQALKARPGTPIDLLGQPQAAVDAAVRAGFLTSVRVRSPTEEYPYLFAPNAQFSGTSGTDLFDKARAVVAALRHGQHHAGVTRIRYPNALLNAFVEGRMAPHSYAVYQYAALQVNGVASIKPVQVLGSTRYQVSFIDTPENRQVIKLASWLLRANTETPDISDPEIVLMFGQGIISGAAKERVARRQKRVAANDSLVQLMRTVRGVRY